MTVWQWQKNKGNNINFIQLFSNILFSNFMFFHFYFYNNILGCITKYFPQHTFSVLAYSALICFWGKNIPRSIITTWLLCIACLQNATSWFWVINFPVLVVICSLKIWNSDYLSDYLSNKSSSSIFLQPTDKKEVANIISSLNSNKASGLNSIPYRILFLLKNEISKQLADLFNLSFMTGVFPSVLKTAKVVPVFKKDSKLDYSNYRPISLLSNIEKILEKSMHKRLFTFLDNKNII